RGVRIDLHTVSGDEHKRVCGCQRATCGQPSRRNLAAAEYGSRTASVNSTGFSLADAPFHADAESRTKRRCAACRNRKTRQVAGPYGMRFASVGLTQCQKVL